VGGAWEEHEDGRREEREERARRILLHRYFLLVLLGNFRVVDHGDGVCIFVAREVLCACAQKSVAKERKKERKNE